MSRHPNDRSGGQPSDPRGGGEAVDTIQVAQYAPSSHGSPTEYIHPTPLLGTISLPDVSGGRVSSTLIGFRATGNDTNWLGRLGLNLRDPALESLLRSNTFVNTILQSMATLPEARQLFVREPFGFWDRRIVNPSSVPYISCMDVVVAFWRHLQAGLTVHEYNMDAHIIVPASTSRAILYGSHDFRRVDRLGDMHYLVGFIWDDAGEVMTAVLSNLP